MSKQGGRSVLEIDGRQVTVSHLDKIFYPKSGFRKGDVLQYYIQIAPYLLPHLQDRPVTLKRYPEGVEGEFFYEKRCPSYRPSWIKTKEVASSRHAVIPYFVVSDLPSIVWAANLANLEWHPFLHRANATTRPTAIVFDLDPGPPAGMTECCLVALELRELLHSLDLECFAKTSGSKGVQLYLPLNGRATYAKTKPFAEAVAQLMETRHPQQIVSRMSRHLRPGKVLIDWSQNDSKKTTAGVYSLRAVETPSVSTPITWTEVELAANKKRMLRFTPAEVLDRVASAGDHFLPVLQLRQTLPELASTRRS